MLGVTPRSVIYKHNTSFITIVQSVQMYFNILIMIVKTRFAPSPTGDIHIGSARIAIINYLFSCLNNGEFILRIDDTDEERNIDISQSNIIKVLNTLNIRYKYLIKQSERNDIYHQYIKKITNKNYIYYDNNALKLNCKAIDSVVTFQDMIFGEITIYTKNIEDFVLVRSNNTFTYMASSVFDDHDLHITNIVRGSDHINNTAKQILLFRAIGAKNIPTFAHIPLLFNDNNQKISKRNQGTTVNSLLKIGILPETIFIYLANIGTCNDSKKIVTIQELLENFNILNFKKNTTKINLSKLIKLNMSLMYKMDITILFNQYKKYLEEFYNNVYQDVLYMDRINLCFTKILYRSKTMQNILDNSVFLISQYTIDNYEINTKQKILIQTIINNFNNIHQIHNEDISFIRQILTNKKNGIAIQDIIDSIGVEESIKRINQFYNTL